MSIVYAVYEAYTVPNEWTEPLMLDMLDVVFTVYIGYTLYSLPTVTLQHYIVYIYYPQ